MPLASICETRMKSLSVPLCLLLFSVQCSALKLVKREEGSCSHSTCVCGFTYSTCVCGFTYHSTCVYRFTYSTCLSVYISFYMCLSVYISFYMSVGLHIILHVSVGLQIILHVSVDLHINLMMYYSYIVLFLRSFYPARSTRSQACSPYDPCE